MNSGKSAKILSLIHEFHEQNKTILTIIPKLATRTKCGYIIDRAGESYKADIIEPFSNKISYSDSFCKQIKHYLRKTKHLDLIVADEAQFLNPSHIQMLIHLVNQKFPNTVIMMFGLLKDYQNHLFTTSKWLIENADDFRELKSTCYCCNRKATCNLRINNGQPVYNNSNLIQIGGNDDYKAVCQYHYYHPVLGGKKL